jgi:hypothetical protein
MRATIVAARLWGAVMMLWGVVLLGWSIYTTFSDPSWGATRIYKTFLEAEQYNGYFSEPLGNIGIGMILVVTAGILDELRRRAE